MRDHLRVEWKICRLRSYNIAINSCLPLLLSHNGTIINVWHAKSEPLQLITRHRRALPMAQLCGAALSLGGERPAEGNPSVGMKRAARAAPRLPPPLGSCFWGLSSGSFKWGLVTAGSSWTKLLLAEALRCCSHSALIGFDCVCFRATVEEREEEGGGVAVKPECVSWCGADTLAFH